MNADAGWRREPVTRLLAREIGVDQMIQTARELGIRTPLQPYVSTALGASEVALLELASAYRAIASEVLAEPYIIARVHDASGGVLYEAPRRGREIGSPNLRLIQEGLRGVVRLPSGTAHALDGREFPIPVMGKTGTTSDFRDALFVGSTYGRSGITVAVRIGFDDNRGAGRPGNRGARRAPDLSRDHAPGPPRRAGGAGAGVPLAIEQGIEEYLARRAARGPDREEPSGPRLDDGHLTGSTKCITVLVQ